MTLDEALIALDLEQGADARAVRAAYLRAIKTHSPERDPEGFKRVRAAYELLKAWSVSLPVQPALAPSADAPAPDAERPTDAPELSVRLGDPLRAYRERVWASEDPTAQQAVAREAVARVGSAEAYSMLIDTLEESGDDDATLAVLREAIVRGHEERFTPVLAERFPHALTEPEVERWASRVAGALDDSWPQLVLAYLHSGRIDRAADLLVSAIEVARRDPLAPRVDGWWLDTLVLALLEAGATAHAVGAFHKAAPVHDLEHPGAPGVARRELVRELVGVAPVLPQEVVAPIAAALRADDPGRADAALRVFSLKKREARIAGAALERQAPLLFQCYARALDWDLTELPGFGAPERSRGPWWWGLLPLTLYVALRTIAPDGCPSNPRLVSQPGSAQTVRQVFCRTAGSPLCDPAKRLDVARDCSAIWTELRALEKAAAEVNAQGVLYDFQARTVERLRADALQRCRAEPDAEGSPR